MSNIKSIGQGVRGLRLPKIGGFPLTLNVALTTVLRTNVLHCHLLLLTYWSRIQIVGRLHNQSSFTGMTGDAENAGQENAAP